MSSTVATAASRIGCALPTAADCSEFDATGAMLANNTARPAHLTGLVSTANYNSHSLSVVAASSSSPAFSAASPSAATAAAEVAGGPSLRPSSSVLFNEKYEVLEEIGRGAFSTVWKVVLKKDMVGLRLLAGGEDHHYGKDAYAEMEQSHHRQHVVSSCADLCSNGESGASDYMYGVVSGGALAEGPPPSTTAAPLLSSSGFDAATSSSVFYSAAAAAASSPPSSAASTALRASYVPTKGSIVVNPVPLGPAGGGAAVAASNNNPHSGRSSVVQRGSRPGSQPSLPAAAGEPPAVKELVVPSYGAAVSRVDSGMFMAGGAAGRVRADEALAMTSERKSSGSDLQHPEKGVAAVRYYAAKFVSIESAMAGQASKPQTPLSTTTVAGDAQPSSVPASSFSAANTAVPQPTALHSHSNSKNHHSSAPTVNSFNAEEAQILSSLPPHESTLSVVDVFYSRTECVIVTEFLEGGEVFEYVSNTSPSVAKGSERAGIMGSGESRQQQNTAANNASASTKSTGDVKRSSDFSVASLVPSLAAGSPSVTSAGGAHQPPPTTTYMYLPDAGARAIVKDLLSAIAHLHANGVCHRDVKLENMLFIKHPSSSSSISSVDASSSPHNDASCPSSSLSSSTMDSNNNNTNYRIKLIDFGFSKRIGNTRPLKSCCGSPNYMPPEMLKAARSADMMVAAMGGGGGKGTGDGNASGAGGGGGGGGGGAATEMDLLQLRVFATTYGKEVDLWSAGVVLYVLLFGEYPFYDARKSVWHKRILQGQYAVPAMTRLTATTTGGNHSGAGILGGGAPSFIPPSPAAVDLLRRLLTVDPHKRITAAEALRHPWLAGSDEAPSLAEEDTKRGGGGGIAVGGRQLIDAASRGNSGGGGSGGNANNSLSALRRGMISSLSRGAATAAGGGRGGANLAATTSSLSPSRVGVSSAGSPMLFNAGRLFGGGSSLLGSSSSAVSGMVGGSCPSSNAPLVVRYGATSASAVPSYTAAALSVPSVVIPTTSIAAAVTPAAGPNGSSSGAGSGGANTCRPSLTASKLVVGGVTAGSAALHGEANSGTITINSTTSTSARSPSLRNDLNGGGTITTALTCSSSTSSSPTSVANRKKRDSFSSVTGQQPAAAAAAASSNAAVAVAVKDGRAVIVAAAAASAATGSPAPPQRALVSMLPTAADTNCTHSTPSSSALTAVRVTSGTATPTTMTQTTTAIHTMNATPINNAIGNGNANVNAVMNGRRRNFSALVVPTALQQQQHTCTSPVNGGLMHHQSPSTATVSAAAAARTTSGIRAVAYSTGLSATAGGGIGGGPSANSLLYATPPRAGGGGISSGSIGGSQSFFVSGGGPLSVSAAAVPLHLSPAGPFAGTAARAVRGGSGGGGSSSGSRARAATSHEVVGSGSMVMSPFASMGTPLQSYGNSGNGNGGGVIMTPNQNSTARGLLATPSSSLLASPASAVRAPPFTSPFASGNSRGSIPPQRPASFLEELDEAAELGDATEEDKSGGGGRYLHRLRSPNSATESSSTATTVNLSTPVTHSGGGGGGIATAGRRAGSVSQFMSHNSSNTPHSANGGGTTAEGGGGMQRAFTDDAIIMSATRPPPHPTAVAGHVQQGGGGRGRSVSRSPLPTAIAAAGEEFIEDGPLLPSSTAAAAAAADANSFTPHRNGHFFTASAMPSPSPAAGRSSSRSNSRML